MTSRTVKVVANTAAAAVPPRPLTAAEQAYHRGRLRYAKRFAWVGAIGIPVALTPAVAYQLRQPRDSTIDLIAAAFLILPLLATLWLVRVARVKGPAGQRVGRYAGLHTLAGLPVTHLIGPFTVELPDGWNGPPVFALDEVVDVEFTPALEDDPDPGHGRLVLSAIGADGRRLKAVDPALREASTA